MYFTCGKTDIACLFSTKQSKSPIWASLLLVQTVGYIDGRCKPAEKYADFVSLFFIKITCSTNVFKLKRGASVNFECTSPQLIHILLFQIMLFLKC